MEIEAFKAKFLPFHPKLYRIAYALVNQKEEAEDLLQETYIRLWNKRDELEAINAPEAFAITILKHLCLDYLRSARANQGESETLETIRRLAGPTAGEKGTNTICPAPDQPTAGKTERGHPLTRHSRLLV